MGHKWHKPWITGKSGKSGENYVSVNHGDLTKKCGDEMGMIWGLSDGCSKIIDPATTQCIKHEPWHGFDGHFRLCPEGQMYIQCWSILWLLDLRETPGISYPVIPVPKDPYGESKQFKTAIVNKIASFPRSPPWIKTTWPANFGWKKLPGKSSQSAASWNVLLAPSLKRGER